MAAIIEKTSLVLEHNNGIIDGKQKIKRQSYSSIKNDATDQGIKVVGEAIDALSAKAVLNTKKQVLSNLNDVTV